VETSCNLLNNNNNNNNNKYTHTLTLRIKSPRRVKAAVHSLVFGSSETTPLITGEYVSYVSFILKCSAVGLGDNKVTKKPKCLMKLGRRRKAESYSSGQGNLFRFEICKPAVSIQ